MSVSELGALVAAQGRSVSPEDLASLIRIVDADGEGTLNFGAVLNCLLTNVFALTSFHCLRRICDTDVSDYRIGCGRCLNTYKSCILRFYS